MFKALMLSRRFAPLFWCQFFAALNDNFVKNALVILILFGLGGPGSAVLVTLAGVTLIAPFFFLSALGGELADRYDKAFMARRLKLAEIPVAGVAALGFVLQSVPILFVAIFLLGSMAALFGPVKYGILPDQLKTSELAAGNALVEGATFMAILLGTIAGGLAVSEIASPWIIAGIVMAMALISWLWARQIPAKGAGAPGLAITVNPLASTLALLKDLKAHPKLWTGGLVTSWFWLVGATMLALLPTLVKVQLAGNERVVTLGLVTFTVGIALGSAIAARASIGRPNLSLVPWGAFAMGLFSLDLAFASLGAAPPNAPVSPSEILSTFSGCRVVFDLFAIAVSAGLFIVPAFAAVQVWADKDRRARVIASVNVLNASFMVGSGILVAGLQRFGVSLAVLFAGLGIANLIAGLLVRRAWSAQIARGDIAQSSGAGE